MGKREGKYFQLQLYISDYSERLIGRELERKGISMAEFLEEIKQDAIMRAKKNLGGVLSLVATASASKKTKK